MQKTFDSIYLNLAKELNIKAEDVQIAISYKAGKRQYDVYSGFKMVRESVDLNRYTGTIIDWTGTTTLMDTMFAPSGVRYAHEMGVNIDEIKIILSYREKDMPEAMLMSGGAKVRNININQEFLQAA